jgi:cysteine desulfurase
MTISLDYHATTPTASEVLDAMMPFWRDAPWNAHSAHAGGAQAERAVARARDAIAGLIGASAGEIVFTSGATEANNLAILGLAAAARRRVPARTRVLTSAIEHKCVLEAARHLATQGFQHEIIPVTAAGLVDVEQLARSIGEDVLLVAVMAANNEIGTIQPLSEVAQLCASAGALFHVDAAQAVGRIPFNVLEAECDTASLSAHKMYGPNGVGALYISAAAPWRPDPLIFGGGQEQGLRPGTLPVPLIAGFGCAAELAARDPGFGAELADLAALFLSELDHHGISVALNGDPVHRLPGSLNFRISGVNAEEVIQQLGGRLHLSTGSACQSGELHGSYILRAIGLSDCDVSASFRACFGRDHCVDDAVNAAAILADALHAWHNGAGRRVQQQGVSHGGVRVGGVQAAVCGA